MMRLLKTPLLFFLGYMSIIVAAIYSIFNLIKNLNPILPKKLEKTITIACFSSDEKIYQNLNKNFINIQAADSDMDTLYLKNL